MLYYITDHLGSTRLILDGSNGNIMERMTYTPRAPLSPGGSDKKDEGYSISFLYLKRLGWAEPVLSRRAASYSE